MKKQNKEFELIEHTKHAVIIEGSPLSGKGTLANFLEERFGYLHVDTGDILRADPVTGPMTESGDLLEDYLVFDAVIRFLPANLPNRICWTGIPRDRRQFEWLSEFLAANGYRVCVVLLDFKEGLWRDRLKQRLNEEGKQRRDSDPDTVLKRLSDYRKYGPVVRSLLCQTMWKVCRINGSQKKKAVRSEAEKLILDELVEMGLTRRILHEDPSTSSGDENSGGELQTVPV